MNSNKYGHFGDGGVILYADNPVIVDGSIVYNPSKQQYNSIGEKELHFSIPEEPAGDGKHWESDGYDETDTDIIRKWRAVDDPVVYNRYYVPDLIFWLRIYDEAHPDAKKGQLVMNWLNDNDLYAIAITTRVVSDGNEIFTQAINAVKEAVGFTDADVTEALAYSITDKYPDEVQ